MTKTERKSSTGGTITEFFKNGQRVRVVHTAGRAYSGKIAQQEDKKAS